jgi:hypothetical protein
MSFRGGSRGRGGGGFGGGRGGGGFGGGKDIHSAWQTRKNGNTDEEQDAEEVVVMDSATSVPQQQSLRWASSFTHAKERWCARA